MRVHELLILLLLLIAKGNVTHAQAAIEDSLKSELKKNIPDTLRVRYLLFLADRSNDDNFNQASQLLDSANRYAQPLQNKMWLANVWVSRAVLFQNLGQMDSALFYYNQVLRYESDQGMALPVSRVWGNLVNYYRQAGDLESALKYAFKSEKYCLQHKKYYWLMDNYTNIAGIFFDLKDGKKSLGYDWKAVRIAEEHSLTDKLPAIYRNLASAYADFGRSDSARFYFRKSLEGARALGSKEEVAHSMQAIGYEYLVAHQLDSASYYFSGAQKIKEEEGYFDESYPMLYCYLGQIEIRKKNYPHAITYLLKADSIAGSIGYVVDQADIKKSLTEAYAYSGNWKSAFAYQQQYVLLNDSMQRDENIRITRELERKYDVAKKESENIFLLAENNRKESQLQARNIVLAALGGGLLLLSLTLFFIFRNYRNEKKHVAILDSLNDQLIVQRDEILAINRLLQLKVLRTQMNPHFIYNCLNGIHNLVTQGESDRASKYLLSFSKLLRMILDFSDKTVVDLEEEITFIRLYLSLEAMRMGDDFSYEISASEALLTDDIGVPSLLIQPFIENALWHGLMQKQGDKKLLVRFELQSDKHHLTCTVEDNGIGRERAALVKSSHGFIYDSKGIRITRERIELLKYQIRKEVSITINDKVDENNESEGTLVKLILPVNV